MASSVVHSTLLHFGKHVQSFCHSHFPIRHYNHHRKRFNTPPAKTVSLPPIAMARFTMRCISFRISTRPVFLAFHRYTSLFIARFARRSLQHASTDYRQKLINPAWSVRHEVLASTLQQSTCKPNWIASDPDMATGADRSPAICGVGVGECKLLCSIAMPSLAACFNTLHVDRRSFQVYSVDNCSIVDVAMSESWTSFLGKHRSDRFQ